MRISDWSSDVCSSDLGRQQAQALDQRFAAGAGFAGAVAVPGGRAAARQPGLRAAGGAGQEPVRLPFGAGPRPPGRLAAAAAVVRSEEHTSELQSLMRTSYAVICLKKTNKPQRAT